MKLRILANVVGDQTTGVYGYVVVLQAFTSI